MKQFPMHHYVFQMVVWHKISLTSFQTRHLSTAISKEWIEQEIKSTVKIDQKQNIIIITER